MNAELKINLRACLHNLGIKFFGDDIRNVADGFKNL
jgi:hypothetical protein